MSDNCIVVQTLHGQSSIAFCGDLQECQEWIATLPSILQTQMSIFSAVNL